MRSAAAEEALRRGRTVRVEFDRLGLLDGALARIDYLDAFARVYEAPRDLDLRVAMGRVFAVPGWIMALLRLRDALVRPLGLRTARDIRDGAEDGSERPPFRVRGEAPDGSEILLGEDDRHLDFRVLLRREPAGEGLCLITLATAVQMHNLLGRAYFAVVRPFHRLVVAALLRSAPRQLVD